MVKPIDPSKPTGGDGNEKYNPNPKRGPGAFDEILDKAKADRKPSGGGGGGGIPKVGPKKPLDMKKGGKVRKFNDGGMSLEEKYPGAKITRAGPQPKPVEQPPKTILQEALREVKEAEYKDLSRKAEKAPYEHKAEKFEKTKGGGGGGSGIPKVGSRRPLDMKKGGKVSSASKRADGCAIKGKTRA